MAGSFVEHSFSCMVEKVSDYAIFLLDCDGIIQTWNPAAEAMKGYPRNEAISRHLSMLYTDEDQRRNHPAHNLADAAEHGTFQESAWRKRKDGSLFWALVELIAIRNEAGELDGFCKLTRDLTNLKLLQDHLAAEKERAELTLHAIADGVISVDHAGLVDYINPPAQRFTGWPQETAKGRPLAQIFNIVQPDDYSTEEARLANAEVSGTPARTTHILRARDGVRHVIETQQSEVPGREGGLSGAVIVFRDVGESLAISAKMAQLANHDFLTGLPNRVLLTDRLVHAIARATKRHTHRRSLS